MSGVGIPATGNGSTDQPSPPNHGEQLHQATVPATTRQSSPLPPTGAATNASTPASGTENPGMGPSIARDEWLDEPSHWLTTGSHQIPRPRVSQQALPRPTRFRHPPRWISAAVLAAVIVGAVVTGILMVHAAGTVIPRHSQPTVAPAHHTATPTHKATPTH